MTRTSKETSIFWKAHSENDTMRYLRKNFTNGDFVEQFQYSTEIMLSTLITWKATWQQTKTTLATQENSLT